MFNFEKLDVWQAPAQTKETLACTAKYPAFAERGKRVQAFFV
jgi:hypothetical protein